MEAEKKVIDKLAQRLQADEKLRAFAIAVTEKEAKVDAAAQVKYMTREEVRKQNSTTPKSNFFAIKLPRNHCESKHLVSATMLSGVNAYNLTAQLRPEARFELIRTLRAFEICKYFAAKQQLGTIVVTFPAWDQSFSVDTSETECGLCDSAQDLTYYDCCYLVLCNKCKALGAHIPEVCEAKREVFALVRKDLPGLLTKHRRVCAHVHCPRPSEPCDTKCGKCKTVAYCSKECQKADWHAVHKAECCR